LQAFGPGTAPEQTPEYFQGVSRLGWGALE
jgi:hypothetical protein